MTSSLLRFVQAPAPEIQNPYPCPCCRHGHELAATELVIRRQRDGEVLRRLKSVPGGWEVQR